MKKMIYTGFALLIILLPLGLQAGNIKATFTPPRVWLNEFQTSSFDPNAPQLQPTLTTLIISNQSSTPEFFQMKLDISWNNVSIISKKFRSKESLHYGAPLILTNRDLITKVSNASFNDLDDSNINLDAILKGDPILRQAVLSGYFPDGDLLISIRLAEDTVNPDFGAPDAVFTISIRNTGMLRLLSPGVLVGNAPTQENLKPVNYLWSATQTGFNLCWITIREYAPQSIPNSGSVTTTGTLFYETADYNQARQLAQSFSFADFLPYNDGHYYAWQITMDRYDEKNPNLTGTLEPPSKRGSSLPGSNTIKSDWNVFKYVADASTSMTSNEIKNLLLQLGNMGIVNLLNNGFEPTGLVNADGRNYTGSEAVRQLEKLLGKDLEISIGN